MFLFFFKTDNCFGLQYNQRLKCMEKNNTCKFSVRYFSGTNVQCMKYFNDKLSLKEGANYFIIHVTINDISDQSYLPESITESIFNLAADMKNESHYVTISKTVLQEKSNGIRMWMRITNTERNYAKKERLLILQAICA